MFRAVDDSTFISSNTHAMNAIIALEIDLKKIAPANRSRLQFNEIQFRSFLAGLSAFHKEVLILSVDEHFAVWATGVDPGILKHSFACFSGNENALVVHTNEDAILFFKNIVKSVVWTDVKRPTLLSALRFSTIMSEESETLHDTFKSLTNWAFHYLQSLPVISAFENFWSFKNELHKEAVFNSIQGVHGLPAILFRASIN
jgi:hypothetical protein